MKNNKENYIIRSIERPKSDWKKIYPEKKKIFYLEDRSPVQDVESLKEIDRKLKEF